MIRKIVRQMLTAQISSALAVSLCLLIDNVMIGRFLGEQSMAAYGLANPLLLSIGALGTLLAAGVQVACAKSLGSGSQEETNAGYSSALAVSGVVSVLFAALVVVFAPFLARVMGAGTEGELFEQTRDYLKGFSIGAPGSMGALVLVPFLQMAGQGNLLIAAVLAMTVVDVALDLLNVLVFHGGMFGMGLASSLSYYAAMAVVSFYFLSGRCVFRFSFRHVRRRKIAELFRSGVPAGFNMAASVFLVFLLNRILGAAGGESAQNGLAAFAVISTIGNSANCITTGIGGVSLTLSGIFFHEEDRTSLKELMETLSRAAVVLGLGMGVILLIFAPAFVGLFIPAAGETRQAAILGLRLFGAGLVPCAVNNALKYTWQGTGRVILTEMTCILEGTAFPVLAAFVFSRFMGTAGVWLYFGLGEWITLLFLGLMVFLKTRELPWRNGAYLLLRDDFGVSGDNLLEMNIHTMQEVAEAVRQAEQFCLNHGQSARVSNRVALCIEEMAGNTIQHGFSMDRKHHDLSVRLLDKKDYWVLRFRDDCSAFDPVHYIPEGEGEALGIRLMLAFAEEANYTYALNMNNLSIRMKSTAHNTETAAPLPGE